MDQNKTRTILVVDDDATVVLGLKKRLMHAGYHVLTAIQGDEALSVARNCPVDAITLDVALGGALSGLEVAGALNRDPRTASIPVIFVTGTADQGFKETCRAVGGTYFLAKPYDAELILRLLESLFAKDELAEVKWLSQAKRRQPYGATIRELPSASFGS